MIHSKHYFKFILMAGIVHLSACDIANYEERDAKLKEFATEYAVSQCSKDSIGMEKALKKINQTYDAMQQTGSKPDELEEAQELVNNTISEKLKDCLD